MVNKELLIETLEYIEEHPEEWDQRKWHCGTAYCFAGHAARIANGGTLVFQPYEGFCYIHRTDTCLDCAFHLTDSRYKQKNIGLEATVALGITIEDADDLFAPDNKLDEIRYIVSRLISE